MNHHVDSPNSSASAATPIRGGPGVAVDAEEEEEDDEDDEDENCDHEALRRLGGRNSQEDDGRGQGNSAGRGAYRQQSDQGSARPERLTDNTGMNIDMDGAGVAPQVEQSGRTEGEDENPGAMDVDADTADVAKRGEQSGAVDVDMREGSINEHDKATNEATPESFPSEKPPHSNVSLSNERTVQLLAKSERTRRERPKQRKPMNCPFHRQKQS